MFDVGWTELLIIGVLALIVVGPRDLPQLLRTVGQWVGKIKRMASEFQRTMEDAAREADITEFKELRDLKKEMGNLDLRKQAEKTRSYLNKPVKLESETAASEKTGDTAATDDAQPSGKPAADGPAAGGSSAGGSEGAGGEAAEVATRQSGASGSGAGPENAPAPAPSEPANKPAEDSSMALSDDAELRQADAKG